MCGMSCENVGWDRKEPSQNTTGRPSEPAFLPPCREMEASPTHVCFGPLLCRRQAWDHGHCQRSLPPAVRRGHVVGYFLGAGPWVSRLRLGGPTFLGHLLSFPPVLRFYDPSWISVDTDVLGQVTACMSMCRLVCVDVWLCVQRGPVCVGVLVHGRV